MKGAEYLGVRVFVAGLEMNVGHFKKIVRSEAYLTSHSGRHRVLSCGLADACCPKANMCFTIKIDIVSPHSGWHRGFCSKSLCVVLVAGWMFARQERVVMLEQHTGKKS